MAPDDILLLMPDAGVAQLEAERAFSALLTVLTPILPATADVSHVGATSIPGCVTKGDLDVVTGFRRQISQPPRPLWPGAFAAMPAPSAPATFRLSRPPTVSRNSGSS
ncbi:MULTISPECIES: hypothetical protein [Methylobacterium]|uniref:hypothetical protein n=1 Tax=Methylobacterium TaxID=407 RepID=UPI00272E7BE2|nr:hypothetical protein [Methylobacterium sp.]